MSPPLPDITGLLIEQLKQADLGVDVDRRRPPAHANQSQPFLRVSAQGGPTSWEHIIWKPIVALEAWATKSSAAHTLGSAATLALARMEGERLATDTTSAFIAAVDVMAACADSAVDGRPVVLTTAQLTLEIHPLEGTQ